jgi:hypothetical protein
MFQRIRNAWAALLGRDDYSELRQLLDEEVETHMQTARALYAKMQQLDAAEDELAALRDEHSRALGRTG